MDALLGVLLALFMLGVLLYPMIRPARHGLTRLADPETPEHLREMRLEIYREVASVYRDFENGDITEEELAQAVADLRLEAAEAMRAEVNRRADAVAIELEIEAQVRLFRELAESGVTDEAVEGMAYREFVTDADRVNDGSADDGGAPSYRKLGEDADDDSPSR